MPQLVLTLNGANGKPNDWNHVLVPFLQIQSFVNATGLGSTNIQDNSITWNLIRANEGFEGLRVKVRNATAATITANTLVYFSGRYNDGTTTYPTIDKAIVTSTATTTFFAQGAVEANIDPADDGTVIMMTEFDGVSVKNTPVNQPVYLAGTAGGWTTDRPGGSDLVQVIGRVSIASTDGQIMINTVSDQDTLRYALASGVHPGVEDNASSPILVLNNTHLVSENRTLIGTSTPTTFGMLVVQEGGMGGIVPSTKADTLVLGHNRDFGITFAGTSTSEQHIYFADPGSDNAGEITYDHATNELLLNAATQFQHTIGGSAVSTWTASRLEFTPDDFTLYLHRDGPNVGGSAEANSLIIQDSAAVGDNAGMAIISGTSGEGSIFFGDSGNGEAGSLTYQHTGDRMVLKANGGDQMWVNSNGVGIGTAAQSGVFLQVQNADSGISPDGDADDLFIEGTANVGMTIGASGASLLKINFAETGDATAGEIRFNISNDELAFECKGNTDQLVLDANDRIGIGVGDPEEIVEINDTTDPTILFWTADSTIVDGQEVGGLEWNTDDQGGTASTMTRRAQLKVSAMTNLAGFRMRINMAAAGTSLAPVTCFEANHLLDVVLGAQGGLATGATTGRPWIPSSAGAPTGTPGEIYTNSVPIQYDRSNNRLYVWNSGWRSVALT
jgi:hypothetical protein